jgi:hypothetical protein
MQNKKIAVLEIYPNKKTSDKIIDAHYRNSKIIADYLSADLLCTEKDFIYALTKNYDVLILGYASFYAPFKLIRKLIEQNPLAKKFVISNEYNIVPSVGGFNPYELICNYEKIPNPGKVIIKQHFINLNLLFAKRSNSLIVKKYDCIYYGTFRLNRSVYFKKYLQDNIYVSTSSKNFKKYLNIGCHSKFIKKLSWQPRKETLNLFRYLLYIEDQTTHDNFNNLANRWYEADFCNCVVFFDKNCYNTIIKSEIGKYWDQIKFYVINSHDELINKINECNQNFMQHLIVQKDWRVGQLESRKEVLTTIKNIVKN